MVLPLFDPDLPIGRNAVRLYCNGDLRPEDRLPTLTAITTPATHENISTFVPLVLDFVRAWRGVGCRRHRHCLLADRAAPAIRRRFEGREPAGSVARLQQGRKARGDDRRNAPH